jgi:acetaldehyde dehydrogenase (acetylating)
MNSTIDLCSTEIIQDCLERAKSAQSILQTFSQEMIDQIVEAMVEAGAAAAEPLAKLAHQETEFGNWPDKITKNLLSTRSLWQSIATMKTCGIIDTLHGGNVIEIASPMGIVAAFIPSTNPTSTLMYKAIIAIKSRNVIVASPHPRATQSTLAATRILQDAAIQAGAPVDAIQCLTHTSRATIKALMQHSLTDVILATGGDSLVQAAYSSGKPAYGVGAGNVPAWIETSANIPKAVADIFFGKTFDYGTLCSSEQAIVCDRSIQASVMAECERQGGYFLDAVAQSKLIAIMFDHGRINPAIVGQSALALAQLAGIEVPSETRVLIAPLIAVGLESPLSGEKLSPVLAFYVVENREAAIDRCTDLLQFGGMGHSMALHTGDPSLVPAVADRLPAHRFLINTPSAVGAVGHTTEFAPALSLGSGTLGGSISADNITPRHLLNIKRIGLEVRPINNAMGEAMASEAITSEAMQNSPASRRRDRQLRLPDVVIA